MPDPARKPRFRFSLTTLVLLTTIVGMGITIAIQWREAGPLRQEVEKYRNELGILRVDDPDKIHALRLPDRDGEPRRYRVYLPPGQNYWFHYRQFDVPARGIAKDTGRSKLEPGEYLFSVAFERQRDKKTDEPLPHGAFDIRIDPQFSNLRSATITVGVSQHNNDWILNKETGNTSFGWQEVGRELVLSSPHEPLVLYRARAHKTEVMARNDEGQPSSWSTTDIEGPCEGLMMWISDQERHE